MLFIGCSLLLFPRFLSMYRVESVEWLFLFPLSSFFENHILDFTLSLKQEISNNNIMQKDIKGRSRNPAIPEMELFAIMVNGFQPL